MAKKRDLYARMIGPLLDELRNAGGEAGAREIMSRVADKVVLDSSERNKVHKGGENAAENEVAWARNYLRMGGFLDASTRGIWRLTDEGWKKTFTTEQAIEFIREQNRSRPKKPDSSTDVLPDLDLSSTEPELISNESGSLIEILHGLPPTGFERFCQHLLREIGLTDVHTTPASSDGGIDGFGKLQINPLVSEMILFQCKKYIGSVGPAAIREFRGALEGRSSRGIFITTGSFTKEAKAEAERDGVKPIELVERNRLIELIERYQIGVRPVTVYEVDYSFFNRFR
jgi:restriction system protein